MFKTLVTLCRGAAAAAGVKLGALSVGRRLPLWLKLAVFDFNQDVNNVHILLDVV